MKQLLDEKIEAMISWVEQQPEGSFEKQFVPGKWSNGEHMEHIRISTRALNKGYKIPKLLMRYKFGVMNRPERPYEQVREKYTRLLKEQNIKAPPAFSPKPITNADQPRIIKWLREEKETMKKFIDKQSEKNLSKYVIPHPVTGKMSLREFVYFTAFHAEHHHKLMEKYNSGK